MRKIFLCLLIGLTSTSWAQITSPNGNYYTGATGGATGINYTWNTGCSGCSGAVAPLPRMTILATNGNVGINTTAPSAGKLQVDFGATNILYSSSGPSDIGFIIRNNSSTANNFSLLGFGNAGSGVVAHIGVLNTDHASTGGGSLFFSTKASNQAIAQRMTIANTGNVGIGTPSPAFLLDVAGTINATSMQAPNLKITGGTLAAGKVLTSDAAGVATWQPTQWTSSGSNVYFNTTGGTIGIGTATPSSSYKLDVTGTINCTGILINNSPFAGGGSQWATTGANIYYNTTGGNVGIGTSNPGTFKLAVEGKIGAREVQVTLASPWPDYVFEKDYKLATLEEIQSYVDENKHLPGLPSAKEIEKEGVQLGEMNALLLKKIEELTLYMIELKKENDQLKSRIEIIEDKK